MFKRLIPIIIVYLLVLGSYNKSSDDGIATAIAQWKQQYGSGWWLWGVAVIDFDKDGDGDILVQQHNGGSKILRNDNGYFRLANVGNDLGGTFRPHVFDFNNDGFPDIAYRDQGNNTFFLNNGGTFQPFNFAYGTGYYPIQHVRDFDSNGFLDFGHDWGRWYGNGTTFVFQEYVNPDWYRLPDYIQQFILDRWNEPHNRFLQVKFLYGDLNNDWELDVIVSGWGAYGGDSFGFYFLSYDDELFDVSDTIGIPNYGCPIAVKNQTVFASSAGLYIPFNGKINGDLSDFLEFEASDWGHEAFFTDEYIVISNIRGQKTDVYNYGFTKLFSFVSFDGESCNIGYVNRDNILDVIVGNEETISIIYGKKGKAEIE